MRQPTIHIPKPCHENWLEMTPEQQGRFCQSCQKTVYDFTKLSDRMILEKIQSQKNICGRFNVSQLNRELMIPKQKSAIWTAGIASILNLLSFGNDKLYAQHKPELVQINQNKIPVKMGEMVADFQNKREMSGNVYDAEFPIPGATIVNLRTLDSVIADLEGLFKIKATIGDTLEIASIGYHKQQHIVESESKIIEILLRPDMQIMNQTVQTGGVCVQNRTFFGRIFHNIGNWFQ